MVIEYLPLALHKVHIGIPCRIPSIRHRGDLLPFPLGQQWQIIYTFGKGEGQAGITPYLIPDSLQRLLHLWKRGSSESQKE